MGILFAFRAATKPSEPKTSSSTNASELGPDSEEAPSPNSQDSSLTAESSNGSDAEAGGPTASLDESPKPATTAAETSKSGSPGFDAGDIADGLTKIESKQIGYLDRPNTTVYERLVNNLQGVLDIHRVVIKSSKNRHISVSGNPMASEYIHSDTTYNDAPYYSLAIMAKSRGIAYASVTLLAEILGDAQHRDVQQVVSSLAELPSSIVELTLQSILTSCLAYQAVGREGAKRSGRTLDWENHEEAIKRLKESDKHVLRKTEEAHRTYCDILNDCCAAWMGSKDSSSSLSQIKSKHDRSLATATNLYELMVAHTETEMRYMALMARSLPQ